MYIHTYVVLHCRRPNCWQSKNRNAFRRQILLFLNNAINYAPERRFRRCRVPATRWTWPAPPSGGPCSTAGRAESPTSVCSPDALYVRSSCRQTGKNRKRFAQVRCRNYLHIPAWRSGVPKQGCQIYFDTIYQNEGKYTKLPQHYQMAV
jgi:hypothetical protein